MLKFKRIHEGGLLADKVYRTFRDVIVRNRVKPGTVLNESEVCEQLGVSRTPVREAFRVLATEGFLTLAPNRCAVVSKMSFTDVGNILQIRGVLEGLAASLIAKNLTNSKLEVLEGLLKEMEASTRVGDVNSYIILNHTFHTQISRLCGNQRLSNMFTNVRDHSHMFRVRGLTIAGRLETSLQEHQEIIEAIKKRDSSRAEAAAKRHMSNTLENILSHIKEVEGT